MICSKSVNTNHRFGGMMKMLEQKHTNIASSSKNRKEHYYLSFSTQIEKLLKICLVLFIISLFMAQIFILSGEDHQAMVNKAIRYEGVFHDDPIEAKAALQRR
jgi:hypothetical protein